MLRSNVRDNDKLSIIQNALTANTRNHMMNSIGIAGGTSDLIHQSYQPIVILISSWSDVPPNVAQRDTFIGFSSSATRLPEVAQRIRHVLWDIKHLAHAYFRNFITAAVILQWSSIHSAFPSSLSPSSSMYSRISLKVSMPVRRLSSSITIRRCTLDLRMVSKMVSRRSSIEQV